MIPEADIAALCETVRAAIDQGRLGSARFLRCIAHVDAPHDVGAALDVLISLAQAWFGSPSAHRHTIGADPELYLSQVVTWPEGQAAVLAVTSSPARYFPRFDLMLIGSRGTLYHEM